MCSLIYGVVVGTFSGGEQLWAAPVKIAAGLMISALICLPSLYIFTCLSGSQARLVEFCGLLAGLLMLMTILLIGFAPVAWIFSQSTESLAWMGTLHLIFWFIATLFGLRFLEAGFSHSNARSHAGFNTWVIIFLLVAVQMTTALRPIHRHVGHVSAHGETILRRALGDCLKTFPKRIQNDAPQIKKKINPRALIFNESGARTKHSLYTDYLSNSSPGCSSSAWL